MNKPGKRGRGPGGGGSSRKKMWKPKGPELADEEKEKLRDSDGLAEPAEPADPANPTSPTPERFPSPQLADEEKHRDGDGVERAEPADPAKLTSPTPARSPSPLLADEEKLKDGDGLAEPMDPVKPTSPTPEPSTGDHQVKSHSRTQVPTVIVSEKGTASVLLRKEDDDFYTVTRPRSNRRQDTKGSGSSATSSEHSSSQDSSSKRGKFRKLSPGGLDQLAEKSKKLSDELKKEQLRQRQQQQQERRRQQQQQQPPSSVESRLKQFLERFAKQGAKVSFSVKKVKFMRDVGCYELEVDFNDIIQHDFQLAVDIVNYTSPEKLQAAAREFIKMHVSDEDKEAAGWCASIAFVSMPCSIIPVTELLGDTEALVDVYTTGCSLSMLSASLLGGFSEHFLDTYLHLGRAWNGAYNLSDMYLINNSQFVLRKKPSFVLDGDQIAQFLAKKADLNRLTELFTPHLDRRKPEEKKNGEPPKASELPLFYMRFCNDLQDVSEEDISKPWFRAYLLNNPTLKMPQARHDLVCSSHLALKRPVSSAVHTLVTENPCPGHKDWRTSISQSTNDVLRQVYHYRENDSGAQAVSGSRQQAASGSGQAQAVSGSGQELGANKASQFEPFLRNIKGIITYDRNLKNHGSKKGLFKSIAEVEVFSSTNLFEYLPGFVKRLISMEHDPLMKDDLKGDFADILSDYKSARVRTIDGSEIKAVPQLSLWEFEQANFIK